MPADPWVVLMEGIVAETPQGLTVILGRARAGGERGPVAGAVGSSPGGASRPRREGGFAESIAPIDPRRSPSMAREQPDHKRKERIQLGNKASPSVDDIRDHWAY